MLSYENLLDRVPDSSKKSEYSLGNFKLATVLEETESHWRVNFFSNLDHLTLHWGLGISKAREWVCPLTFPSIQLPSSTTKFDEKAAQSPFVEITSNTSTIEITFAKENPPLQLNFVLKRENNWFNNSGSDYCVVLREIVLPGIGKISDPGIKTMIGEIIETEMSGGAWTLMHRFNLCNSWIQRISNNSEGLAWVYVWMRYSAMRKLDWQRNHNTRPSELASSQKNLTFSIVNLLRNSDINGLDNNTMIVRGILGTMGKGGDNGQRIRDEILQIMQRHKIKIHNAKLALENYYEQWHQKLHNNTTPDDIGICEAIIRYNESSSMQVYWETLSKHGLTKERLSSFERPINVEPYLAPQIVPDLYNYLELLKQVHGSADLTQSINCCKPLLPAGTAAKLEDILKSLTHWDKIGQMEKTLQVRKEINCNGERGPADKLREVVYLDLSLEGYTRQLCEEIIHLHIGIPHLCRELAILLESISLNASTEEMNAAIRDYLAFYRMFAENLEKKENALVIKSCCDRVQRLLGAFVDAYTAKIDAKAKFLGQQFLVEKETIDIFTEDLIRGSLFFAVSLVLRKVDTELRKICQLKPWQIISPRSGVKGRLTHVDSLHSVAYDRYEEPVVLICNKVTGEEEIPEGAVAVICSTELDALAHVCVRARNNKVLLAICFDKDIVQGLQGLIGQWVELKNTSGGISITRTEASALQETEVVAREVKKPLPLQSLALKFEEFQEGRTGAKANNCYELKKNLPHHIGVPNSAALPYGTFEFLLSQPENTSISSQISSIISDLANCRDNSMYESILCSLKAQTNLINISADHTSTIQSTLSAISCSPAVWDLAWTAIKQVWASKFNERVYISLMKSKIQLADVVMSVLCQEVICADYAFVLHTRNPMNNNAEEIYGEIVVGLGETLVGAYEGRALAFIGNKASGRVELEGFPSKSASLNGSGFIFRSDSNSEDLPGFAGAGLFDSFIMNKPREDTICYSQCQLVVDEGYRGDLLRQLKDVGIMVEDIFCGVPQDIEGVVKGNQVFIVQSRPQV